MATLTIRNLPPDAVKRLKERAKRNGRSMEQEAREILGQRLATRSELLSEMRSRWADIAAPPSASDVKEWIDAGRRGRK
jgi:plasmid stability protein